MLSTTGQSCWLWINAENPITAKKHLSPPIEKNHTQRLIHWTPKANQADTHAKCQCNNTDVTSDWLAAQSRPRAEHSTKKVLQKTERSIQSRCHIKLSPLTTTEFRRHQTPWKTVTIVQRSTCQNWCAAKSLPRRDRVILRGLRTRQPYITGGPLCNIKHTYRPWWPTTNTDLTMTGTFDANMDWALVSKKVISPQYI